jgi:predicted PurR-regulated permease PerM
LVVVVAALYFGRDVFVPLALAGLLSFALAPLIAVLRNWGIPRTSAVLTVVVAAFLGIFSFGFIVAGQVSQLGASLPRY